MRSSDAHGMNDLLLDLLRRRAQVRFTQSAGNAIGSWPPVAGPHTKCWVHLEGIGPFVTSDWLDSPESALRQAHERAVASLSIYETGRSGQIGTTSKEDDSNVP
jgi:hypothetical protein